MQVHINETPVDISEKLSCFDVLKQVFGKKADQFIACKVNNTELLDLSMTLPINTKKITPITLDMPEGLKILRHSSAHIMAAAVKNLFPHVYIAIGPAIEHGFYYDFDTNSPFSPENFPTIEKEMQKIINKNLKFERIKLHKSKALELFIHSHEKYKVEILENIPDDEVTLYKLEDFIDLCKGPHIPHTNFVKAFHLLSVAGAYWKGNEKNKMLSRIYGTAFPDKKSLNQYLKQLEEAKKRDHRKLGKDLNLFEFHEDVAPGMVYWQPKGMLLRTILEDFLKKEHLKRGYQLVQGPQLLKQKLWEKSGHYDNYQENMYFVDIEHEKYGIKPMNCVSHMLIYNSHHRSYRELPQRYFELGVVHRHEKSGVLHGLLRVRQFTQDDAHIICSPEQLEEEITYVIAFVNDIMSLFNFTYRVVISTKPEKAIGSEEAWELATAALFNAVQHIGLPYSINHGDGAFYGPKIDIKLTDAIGREWQLSTIQCDFTLPARFELQYTASDGQNHQPVMIHRAILGSLERFIGILIEHYMGCFPTWLTPIQAKILTITDAQNTFAEEAYKELKQKNIRVELDTRSEKLGFKIREAQLEKIPYILVIGNKEVDQKSVNTRLHTGENIGIQSLSECIEYIQNDCDQPFKAGGMNYRFSYY